MSKEGAVGRCLVCKHGSHMTGIPNVTSVRLRYVLVGHEIGKGTNNTEKRRFFLRHYQFCKTSNYTGFVYNSILIKYFTDLLFHFSIKSRLNLT